VCVMNLEPILEMCTSSQRTGMSDRASSQTMYETNRCGVARSREGAMFGARKFSTRGNDAQTSEREKRAD
jgi:hypothetical protein